MNECFLSEWLKPAGSRQIDVKCARHCAGSVVRELDSTAPDTVNCGLLPDIPVAWAPKPFHRHTQDNLPRSAPKDFLSTVYRPPTPTPNSCAVSRMWDLQHSNAVCLRPLQSASIARLATSKTNVWQQRVSRILGPESRGDFSVTIISLLIDWPVI